MNKLSGLLLLFLHFSAFLFSQSIPEFSYSFPDGNCAPNVTVMFNNISSVKDDVDFYWNFGDGSQDFLSNEDIRNINYSTSKNYIVKLRAVYASGEEAVYSDTIVIVNSPKADFFAEVKGCVPTQLYVKDTSTLGDAPIVEYKWNFGGGKYEYGEEFEKQINVEGTYPVYLNITDANGCQSVIQKNIKAYERPSAAFTINNNFSCVPPLNVLATPIVENNPDTKYMWDFGNSAISSEQNPAQVTYSSLGDFPVSLTTYLGDNCFAEEVHNVHLGAFDALFNMYYGIATSSNQFYSNQAIPIGKVLFENIANDTLQYRWDIDGVSSENITPEVVFCNDGLFNAVLTVGTELDCPGSDTAKIRVSNSSEGVITLYQNNEVVLTDAQTGSFRFESPYPGATNKWTFNNENREGDIATYFLCETGEYIVELEAAFDDNCSSTLTRTITVVDPNDTTIIVKQDGVEITGDIANVCDGTIVVTAASPITPNSAWLVKGETRTGNILDVSFCETGKQIIELKGTFSNGCKMHSTKHLEIYPCPGLEDDFGMYMVIDDEGAEVEIFDNDTICINETYYVEPIKPENLLEWTFETERLGTFYFVEPPAGIYDMGMVTLKDNGCIDTIEKTVYVAEVKADFNLVDPAFACPFPFETDFNNTSQLARWYEWNVQYVVVGDTLVDTVFSKEFEPHLYADYYYRELDKYRHTIDTTELLITLNVSSIYGCDDSKTISVKKRMPLARFTPNVAWGCAPLTVSFESQDEPGFDFIDSIPVLNPITGLVDTALRRRYNEITSLYWIYGDGTPVEQVTGPELQTMQQDIRDCYMDVVTALGSSYVKEVEKFEREQEGYGIIHYVNEFLKVYAPDKYKQFMDCWKARKDWSNRIQEHTYTTPGIYHAYLVVEDENGCRDTSYSVEIEVGRALDLDFEIINPNVCYYDTVQIKDLSADANLVQTWHYYSDALHLNSYCSDLGSPELTITPVKSGPFDITLRAGYNGCFSEITKSGIVNVLGPVSEFDFSMHCNTPYDYTFDGAVSGATSWYWDFGDSTATVADVQSTIHQYTESGDYQVNLVSTNDTSGCNDHIFTHTIKARKIDVDSILDFFICPRIGAEMNLDSAVDFSTSRQIEPFAWYINGEGYRRDWFGVLDYLVGDTGTVTLTAIAMDENLCTDTITQTAEIHVPHVDIEVDQDYLCGPADSATFRFVDFDSSLTRWVWDFGDFQEEYQFASDSVDSVRHEYKITRDKRYVVQVLAEDSLGCFNSDTVSIQTYYRTADFTMPSNTVCDIDTALFINVATELDSSYWNLGDTSFVTIDSEVSHYYDSFGVYPIVHIAYYKTCTDSLYWHDSVGVGMPNAQFFAEDTILCAKEIASLHMKYPMYDADGLWTFLGNDPDYLADSVSFPYEDSLEYYRFYTAGRKKVKLRLDYGSCSDSAVQYIDVNGAYLVADNRNSCVGDTIHLRDTMAMSKTYTWTIFGNDIYQYTDTVPYFDYPFPERGKYSVMLVASSPGCNDTISKLDYIDIQKVVAEYTVSDDTICYNEEIVFTHAPNLYDAESGEWWFNELIPTDFVRDTVFIQPYVQLGTTETKLILRSSNGCVDTARHNVYIGGVKPDIFADPTYICAGDEVHFSYTTSDENMKPDLLEWFFQGGGTASDPSPDYIYPISRGIVNARLFFTDSVGCRVPSDPVEIEIANVLASFNFLDDTVCVGQPVETENTSVGIVHYEWKLQDTIATEEIFTLHQGFVNNGEYTLLLRGDDGSGCESDTVQSIYVQGLPDIRIAVEDSICLDSSVVIEALYTNPDKVEWFINGFPDFRQSNPRTDKPVENTMYTVRITDSLGCSNADTAHVFVQQYPNHIVPSDTIMAIGDTIHFFAGSDVQSVFTWNTTETDISCTDCPNPSVYSFNSAVYTLTIKDWCVTKDYDIYIDVIPTTKFDVPSAFTPNGDGENELLRIRGWGIKEILEFDVFNRWGQLLYSSTDMNGGWDGTYNGKDQPMETYVWKARVLTFLGEELVKKGYVTLIR